MRIIKYEVSELGIKYLLSVLFLTGIVLDTKNSSVNKIRVSAFRNSHFNRKQKTIN